MEEGRYRKNYWGNSRINKKGCVNKKTNSKIVSYSLNDRLNDGLNVVLNDGLNESEHELLTIIAVAPSVTQDWYCEKKVFLLQRFSEL